jgi:hypothetical protein
MSPISFMIEGPMGEEAYYQSKEISKLIFSHIEKRRTNEENS